MCGICGIFNRNGRKVDEKILRDMNLKLYHRGPDEEGYFIKDNLSIAMRRLSIIDLTTGSQPIFSEDGKIAVVMNGEIYNFQELRNKLIEKKHIFKTKTDTEVVVHLYEEEGINFPNKLRGMFAIAIVDLREEKIILVRDRFGKKPLYYFTSPESFVFSSEINSILQHPAIKKEIDLNAVNMYLTLQYIPSPLSIFKNIKKLKAACLMEITYKGEKTYEYWRLNSKEEKIDFEEAKDKLRNIAFEATKIRMIADVEVGAFLSGGIDSSIVVGMMSQLSSKPVKTFSIGFDEERFSELEFARKVAEKFATHHTELIIKDKMIDAVFKIPQIYGEPFADPSALPTYYVSKITSNNLKVALNGDGGDEVFGGYTRYVFIKNYDFLAKLKMLKPISFISPIIAAMKETDAPFSFVWRLRKVLKAISLNDTLKAYISSVSFFDPWEKEEYLSEKFLSNFKSDPALKYLMSILNEIEGDILRKVSYTDLRSYLAEGLMTKMDRASMANSLEARSPFLDHILVEFAFSLPSEYKIKGMNKTKYILKEAFSDILPPEIKKRGKMGFTIPLGRWFRKELKEIFEENCIKDGFIKRGYFKEDVLKKIWHQHISGIKDYGYKLWAILILELWHKNYTNDFKI